MNKFGNIFRKTVSFALLITAGIALIGFFMSVGTVVFDPFADAFNPFSIAAFGKAVYGFMEAISLPLIMVILGIIGLTLNSSMN